MRLLKILLFLTFVWLIAVWFDSREKGFSQDVQILTESDFCDIKEYTKLKVCSFKLKNIIDTDKEYFVWIETSDDMCRYLGDIRSGDLKIVFVEKFQPKPKPKSYSTIPLYKKELPNGSTEFRIETPEGIVIERIPPLK